MVRIRATAALVIRPDRIGSRIEVIDAEEEDCPANPEAPDGLSLSVIGADCQGEKQPAISRGDVRP